MFYKITLVILSIFCLTCITACDKSKDVDNENNKVKDVEIQVIRNESTVAQGKNQIDFGKYKPGDIVRLTTAEKFVSIKLCDEIEETIVYIQNGKFEFTIPSGDDAKVFKNGTFDADKNVITAIVVSEEKLSEPRNLAFNPLDFRYASEVTKFDAKKGTLPVNSAAIENNEVLAYPHAYANRITRNEAQFYARNAIDGINTKNGHGYYPYQSWGGGLYDDLEFVIYFGREVTVSKIAFAMRSDFNVTGGKEHDTYWDEITVEFSDGTTQVINTTKTGDLQEFEFNNIKTTSVRIKNLKRNNDTPSQMYAALNEIQVWGN